MQISGGWRTAGLVALGLGAGALVLSACGTRGSGATDGPMSDLTKDLFDRLKPGSKGPLDVATQGVREIRRDNGTLQGTYDGTRLLTAADAHSYGTPAIIDPQRDVQGDGKASFNEVRQVVRHFDADADLAWSQDEARAFEGAVGIRWIPGVS
ncbi:MAG: hypothetical protein JWL76_1017 [Thermoleophilia bacterium]|nr:hypothetical protein [Thermoleophilia bacterium]